MARCGQWRGGCTGNCRGSGGAHGEVEEDDCADDGVSSSRDREMRRWRCGGGNGFYQRSVSQDKRGEREGEIGGVDHTRKL